MHSFKPIVHMHSYSFRRDLRQICRIFIFELCRGRGEGDRLREIGRGEGESMSLILTDSTLD